MLCKLVSAAVFRRNSELQSAERKAGEKAPELEPVPSASATTLSDKAIAIWLRCTPARVEAWEGKTDFLAVLRDELSILEELTALGQEVMEHSGTWEPESADAKKSEEELIADYWTELVETHGSDAQKAEARREAAEQEAQRAEAEQQDREDEAAEAQELAALAQQAAAQPEPAQAQDEEDFDTKDSGAREHAIYTRFKAASVKKAPKLDPPRLEDTRRMVREDTPWYISAAFVKIFQTGEGDYWAYAKAREQRGLPISLHDWVKQVLMGRDGRALRHPRFFYFAVNTILRNKAVRGKSFFVKKSFGGQAWEEFTPQQLLQMGKASFTRVLCAYETNLPGSAAEIWSCGVDGWIDVLG